MRSTAQTFAKVGIYADQRIGEILRELPTKQGKRTDVTSVPTVTEVSKREAEQQAGISHKQSIDLQKMAANPEVVEAVIAKAEHGIKTSDAPRRQAHGASGFRSGHTIKTPASSRYKYITWYNGFHKHTLC